MRSALLTAILLMLSVCAACGPASGVRIAASRQEAMLDASDDLIVSGLQAHQQALVMATAQDCNGTRWADAASFSAGGNGVIDIARAAPSAGDFAGAGDAGLLWAMTPVGSDKRDYQMCPPAHGISITFTVAVAGTTAASVTVLRTLLASGETETDIRPETSQGLYGDYFAPPPGTPPRPGIVIFGGAEGGLHPLEAALLAAHGYPVLALAYFGERGLPQTLQQVPLEYFEKAIRWVEQQRGVARGHVAVIGTSRGSEAALLAGVHFPTLVHAVVARVPSSVSNCGFSGYFQCSGAAWTLHGADIPYTTIFNDPHPPYHPDAVIPVEQLNAPLLLSCGGADAVWSSCAYADAIRARAARGGAARITQLLTYPSAGHGVGTAIPDLPEYSIEQGGTNQSTALARIDFWQQQLAFLAAYG